MTNLTKIRQLPIVDLADLLIYPDSFPIYDYDYDDCERYIGEEMRYKISDGSMYDDYDEAVEAEIAWLLEETTDEEWNKFIRKREEL